MHKISTRARRAKAAPLQSYLFAEQIIDVAREADEYKNIAM
jgi:hypothetical protein